ncbi:MAG: SEC-C metal-binding domain-containing protein [Actinomycetota bacterium]
MTSCPRSSATPTACRPRKFVPPRKRISTRAVYGWSLAETPRPTPKVGSASSTATRNLPRNSATTNPCPCGSGRRFQAVLP